MPKFIVCLQHYVEQIAEFEVEAGSEAEARDTARTCADRAAWTEGGDSTEVQVYAVLDADRNRIWER